MCCSWWPRSLIIHKRLIGECSPILTVGNVLKVVVLLSFRLDLSRSLRLPNVATGATKVFMDAYSNIWIHHRPSRAYIRLIYDHAARYLTTILNKRSLNTKNGLFSYLLIFFLCVRAMSSEDDQKRTYKMVM
jgi:hypothetical protein